MLSSGGTAQPRPLAAVPPKDPGTPGRKSHGRTAEKDTTSR